MVKLSDDAVIELHNKIQATTSTYETLNLSVTDKSNIVGTIIVDNSIFNVTARVIAGHPDDGAGSEIQLPAQAFTVLCGITDNNGTLTGDYWEYQVPHPFNGLEYIVTVLDSVSQQEQHVDVIKHSDYAIINIAQQATHCYDVTFIGYVA